MSSSHNYDYAKKRIGHTLGSSFAGLGRERLVHWVSFTNKPSTIPWLLKQATTTNHHKTLQTTTNHQQTTTNHHKRPPTTTNDHQPPANNQKLSQATTNHKQTTTNHQQTTAKHQQTTTNDQINLFLIAII